MAEGETILNVVVADGKYRVVLKEGGGLHALRWGEPWRDLCGDNLVLALASGLDDARKRIKELEWELDLLKETMDKYEECRILYGKKEPTDDRG